MKNLKQITLILFGILLAGCTNETEERTEVPAEEVKFSSGISFVEETMPMTRATFDDQENGGLKLIIRDVRNDGDKKFVGDVYTNGTIGATTDGVNGVTCTPVCYWDDLGGKDASLTIIGIHPANIPDSDNVTYTLNENQSNGLKSHELMFAVVNGYQYADRSTPAALTFNHSLAKISITLKPTSTFPLDKLEELTAADISFMEVPLKAKFNILTGELVDDNQITPVIESVTPLRAEVKNGTSTEAYSFSILAIPYSISADDNIIATVKLGDNTYNVKADKVYTFSKGQHTNFTVTISKTEVTAKASIADWGGPSEIDLGTTRLVELGNFTINTAPTGVTIEEGAIVNMKLTDNNGITHVAKFTYTELKWQPTTPVYWDDIHEAVTAVEALLITKPIDENDYTVNANGEYYFAGSIKDQNYTWETSPTIDLDVSGKFFTRPLSKVNIAVKTSTGDDKVDLTAITKVIIPGKVDFIVGGTSTAITLNTTADLEVTGSFNDEETLYTCATAYIYPQTDLDKLCQVTIGNNVYKVALTGDTRIFEAGKHYSYTVTITKTNVGFTATLKDWEKETGGDLPGEL